MVWDTHLVELVGTLAAQVVLARQDDHGLGEHLQADGADELPLQGVHGLVPVVGAQLQGQSHDPRPQSLSSPTLAVPETQG